MANTWLSQRRAQEPDRNPLAEGAGELTMTLGSFVEMRTEGGGSPSSGLPRRCSFFAVRGALRPLVAGDTRRPVRVDIGRTVLTRDELVNRQGKADFLRRRRLRRSRQQSIGSTPIGRDRVRTLPPRLPDLADWQLWTSLCSLIGEERVSHLSDISSGSGVWFE